MEGSNAADPARGRSRSDTEGWRSRIRGNPKEHVSGPKIEDDQTGAEGDRKEHHGTDLEHVGLEVSAHSGSSDSDDEGGEGIERSCVARRLSNCLAHLASSLDSSCGSTSEPSAQTTRFKTHSDEAGKPEHDGNADVLHLLRGERVARVCAEAFHPGVGDTV